jgi:hypothetical protein
LKFTALSWIASCKSQLYWTKKWEAIVFKLSSAGRKVWYVIIGITNDLKSIIPHEHDRGFFCDWLLKIANITLGVCVSDG